MSESLFSLGLGLGSQNTKGEWLDIFYPQPLVQPSDALCKAIAPIVEYKGGNAAIAVNSEQMSRVAEAAKAAGDSAQADIAAQLASSSQPLVVTLLAEDAAPSSVPEGYLKLHLLSHRLAKPHSLDLTGLFGVLPNVAWTNQGPVDLRELPQRQLDARMKGELLEIMSVDKFPKMTNYVVPAGVRIAHTARVRLGAYLGEGTTIMHEGFINFNAGT
ncbi:tetrahydrodipicolinate N-succinyltransferase N-terminal domain-containing protein, partial [Spongiibacter tropicus]|uniref:tetrahydrodipicolinate N-succinyltransferase N-terminal domain-containing protein n=1 Tax=Spongiibacter tropicus TaxID=454602 RepID=UPI0035BE54BD